jgi:hypothetical protein
LNDYTDTNVTSYYYPKDTTLTSYYYGISIGSRAPNQVYLANWHEASDDEGLEILVAKNAVRYLSIFYVDNTYYIIILFIIL